MDANQWACDICMSDFSFNISAAMTAQRQAKHNPDGTFLYRFDGYNGGKMSYHGWDVCTRAMPTTT